MRDAPVDMSMKYFKEACSAPMVFVATEPPTRRNTMLASAMRI
jgi:hypothetical protein